MITEGKGRWTPRRVLSGVILGAVLLPSKGVMADDPNKGRPERVVLATLEHVERPGGVLAGDPSNLRGVLKIDRWVWNAVESPAEETLTIAFSDVDRYWSQAQRKEIPFHVGQVGLWALNPDAGGKGYVLCPGWKFQPNHSGQGEAAWIPYFMKVYERLGEPMPSWLKFNDRAPVPVMLLEGSATVTPARATIGEWVTLSVSVTGKGDPPKIATMHVSVRDSTGKPIYGFDNDGGTIPPPARMVFDARGKCVCQERWRISRVTAPGEYHVAATVNMPGIDPVFVASFQVEAPKGPWPADPPEAAVLSTVVRDGFEVKASATPKVVFPGDVILMTYQATSLKDQQIIGDPRLQFFTVESRDQTYRRAGKIMAANMVRETHPCRKGDLHQFSEEWIVPSNVPEGELVITGSNWIGGRANPVTVKVKKLN